LENGVDTATWEAGFSRKEIYEKFSHLPAQQLEEIWKFSLRKWQETVFENLEAAMIGDEVASLSGCRRYSGNLLRVSMHLYTRAPFRKDLRNIQFTPDGFFARHLGFARSQSGIEALFMTIFCHDRKTEALRKCLGERRLHAEGADVGFFYDFQVWPEPLLFHGVQQHFFFYPLNDGFQFTGEAPVPAAAPARLSGDGEP
jgi:hypothetical protein